MKLKIQNFSNWDDLKEIYNQNIQKTQTELNNAEVEKNNLINDYNSNYDKRLSDYDNLLKDRENYINNWAETQKENQQRQTDYNISLINQNKQEAQKNAEKETKDAYVDYMKQTNEYGGAAETLASKGLATQGYSESSRVGMYNTYQNRVATTNAALTKANTEYNNQISQALLNNDVQLAEIALNQMQESYKLALEGFEYKDTMYNNKINYINEINNNYFSRKSNLQDRIDNYNSQISNISQIQDQLAESKAQRQQEHEQWLAEFNEKKRQFNEELAENKRQYNNTYSFNYSDNSTTKDDAKTTTEKAGYIGKTKMETASFDTGDVKGLNEKLGLNNACYSIYKNGNKYYYYDPKEKQHVDITDYVNKNKKTTSSKSSKKKFSLKNLFMSK